MQPRQRDRVPPVRLDPLARPLRDQSRRNHHAVVAKIPDLPAQPVPLGGASKQTCRRSYRLPSFLIVRSIAAGLFSISPRNRTSPVRPPSAIATACFIWATSNAQKPRYVAHGSPSVREARLGPPEQPSVSI